MANLIFDKAQIEATIDKIVDRTMRMDMTWDWPCGVAYYGICEAYEVTKNERYLQLVKDRVDEYIELGLPSWTVNTCCADSGSRVAVIPGWRTPWAAISCPAYSGAYSHKGIRFSPCSPEFRLKVALMPQLFSSAIRRRSCTRPSSKLRVSALNRPPGKMG